jgi:hypothetical protein
MTVFSNLMRLTITSASLVVLTYEAAIIPCTSTATAQSNVGQDGTAESAIWSREVSIGRMSGALAVAAIFTCRLRAGDGEQHLRVA